MAKSAQEAWTERMHAAPGGNQAVTKFVHNAPTQDEIYAFNMQVNRSENYTTYRILLGATSEGQKERLSRRFGIPMRILEDEPDLVLKIMNEVG